MGQRVSDVHQDVVTESTETRDPLNVGKVAAFILGAINVVIGAVGLARAGFENPTGEAVSVGGMEMTALLAMIHLVVGALTLAGAVSAMSAKSSLATMGALLLIAGVIALIEPIESLGWNDTNGIVYIVLGGASLVAGMMTTERSFRKRSYVEESTI